MEACGRADVALEVGVHWVRLAGRTRSAPAGRCSAARGAVVSNTCCRLAILPQHRRARLPPRLQAFRQRYSLMFGRLTCVLRFMAIRSARQNAAQRQDAQRASRQQRRGAGAAVPDITRSGTARRAAKLRRRRARCLRAHALTFVHR